VLFHLPFFPNLQIQGTKGKIICLAGQPLAALCLKAGLKKQYSQGSAGQKDDTT